MADGQESFSVPFEKLNGSNWEEWSRKLKAWLVAKGLWEATQGPPQQAAAGAAAAVVAAAQASQRKDQKALGAIVLSLEGSQLPLVEGLETAQEAYQALERVHHRTTAGAKIHTTRSLFELKLRPGDSIRQHVTKMLSVFNKLRLLQVNFTEELKVYILLSSLDKSYDNLSLTLESMNPADLTLQYVTRQHFLPLQNSAKNSAKSSSFFLSAQASIGTGEVCRAPSYLSMRHMREMG
ncbi:Hypothetical predicted protein [Podarcis lilfordi]|uniref:DUF4219 domain-containing protein n=1 Tax=Podarcis lilfordi TaxID=74358 RepID=A0AA35PD20_9SAUR|nr:Hypothetical predicted protein [Podarcis lilfordi]